MKVVVMDRRYKGSLLGQTPGKYTLELDIDYPAIPSDLPLTIKTEQQYLDTKNELGFTTFRGLGKEDIISILAAVKRQEAHVNVNRMGVCAYYKLNKSRIPAR